MNDTIETHEEKKDRGFTLIELLIVIVILGILATVTVFAVSGITDRGNDSACDADEQTLEVAAEAFFAQEGSYPADEDAMVNGGFLRAASTKHNYNFVAGADADDPGSFTIDAVDPGDCA